MSRLSMHYTTTRPRIAIARRWLALPVVLLFAFIVVDMPLAAQTEWSDTVRVQPVWIVEEMPDYPREIEWFDTLPEFHPNMPEFPGGFDSLHRFIAENIRYPENNQADSIQGTVIVQFMVNKEGNVRDIEVLRSPHEDLSKEAIRVVGLMPRWTPGRQRGKTVDEYFNLPIRFSLE